MVPEDAHDGVKQRGSRNGFDEKSIGTESGPHRPLHGFFPAVGRDHDDMGLTGDVPRGADIVDGVESIHVAETPIDHKEVKRSIGRAGEALEGSAARVRCDHVEVERFQDGLEDFTGVVIVVRHQHSDALELFKGGSARAGQVRAYAENGGEVEGASRVRNALNGDGAAHEFDETLANGEAEAGATVATCR
jgi:hypothetical protein